MDPNKIKQGDPFIDLFPIDNKTMCAIMDDMEANGYDPAQPIVVWKEKGIVVDGHTRLDSALALWPEERFADIPVVEKSFKDEDAAVEYAIHCQRDRRNVTDADLLRWIGELDKRRQSGERTDLATGVARSLPRSSEETAEAVGTTRGKVEKARTVLDHAPEEVKQEVLSGKKSINAGYNETRAARKGKQEPLPNPRPRATHGAAERMIEGLRIMQQSSAALVEEGVPERSKTGIIRNLVEMIQKDLSRIMETVEKGM